MPVLFVLAQDSLIELYLHKGSTLIQPSAIERDILLFNDQPKKNYGIWHAITRFKLFGF
jgi:hypothetical protein